MSTFFFVVGLPLLVTVFFIFKLVEIKIRNNKNINRESHSSKVKLSIFGIPIIREYSDGIDEIDKEKTYPDGLVNRFWDWFITH